MLCSTFSFNGSFNSIAGKFIRFTHFYYLLIVSSFFFPFFFFFFLLLHFFFFIFFFFSCLSYSLIIPFALVLMYDTRPCIWRSFHAIFNRSLHIAQSAAKTALMLAKRSTISLEFIENLESFKWQLLQPHVLGVVFYLITERKMDCEDAATEQMRNNKIVQSAANDY